MEWILSTLNADYTEKIDDRGLVVFYVKAKDENVLMARRLMPKKQFGPWLLEMDRATLDLFTKEFFLWDGCYERGCMYSSSDKENSIWVQTILSLSGTRAYITSKKLTTGWAKKTHHYVNSSWGKAMSMTTNFTSTDVVWSGKVYCVTVPSSYVLVRRNGRISVTGNSKQKSVNLRQCFGPAPGREWWSLDAQNIELRLPAYEAGEQAMIDLFERPNDPPYYGSNHLLACDILHPEKFAECVRDGVSFKDRYKSTWYQWVKNGNFAVQYGAQEASGTADKAYHIPGAQAKIQKRLGRISDLNKRMIAFAEKHGYVETIPDKTVSPTKGYPLLCTRTDWGRILPTVPLSYHIQGTACWWMMKAMIRCHTQLEQWRERGNFDGFITMQVHDELVFDLPKSRVPPKKEEETFRTGSNLWRVRILQKLMARGGDDIGIPTPVSVEYHLDNWSEGETL